VPIAGLFESPETCSYTQQNSSWIENASWLSLIRFWPVDNNICVRTSHIFLLPLFSPIYGTKSWLHKSLSQVQVDLNRGKRQTLLQTCHLLRHSCNTDTSQSTATQQLLPQRICPRMHTHKRYIKPNATRIRCSNQLDVSNNILKWTVVKQQYAILVVKLESNMTNSLMPILGKFHG